MTKDFYSLLGSLQSLLFYLYDSRTGDPEEFFELLASDRLVPADKLHEASFVAVRRFYLLAAGSARALALAVNDLRKASSALREHPSLQSAERRALAAGAAGISLEATGGNSWFDAAVALAAADTLPPPPDLPTLAQFQEFSRVLRSLTPPGQQFEHSLAATARTAERLCAAFKENAGGFYRGLQPLLASIVEFDPELQRLLADVLREIKQSMGLDGSGDGGGTWPSGYISSSSSSGSYHSSSSSS